LALEGERVGEINVEMVFYPDGKVRTGGEASLGLYKDTETSDHPEDISE